MSLSRILGKGNNERSASLEIIEYGFETMKLHSLEADLDPGKYPVSNFIREKVDL